MKTEIIAILDASGSMYDLKDDTIGGFNSLIAQQKKEEGEAYVTLVCFNSKYQKILDRVPLPDVRPLTEKEYVPTSMTALLDAVGKTLTEYQPAEDAKVIVSITTDGLENASREYNYKLVKKIVEDKQKLGWEIVFIGANIDSVEEAEKLGIAKENAVNYLSDSVGTQTVYKAMSANISNYRKKGKMLQEAMDEIRADYAARTL